jgi:hypothetical protein
VRNGLVSTASAEQAYGVVLRDAGVVDTDATAVLRADLAGRRDAGSWNVPIVSPINWTL